jgi:hypothetical protein
MQGFINLGEEFMRKLVVYAAFAVCISAPVVVDAALPSLPGLGSKPNSGPDLGASQTGLVKSYVGANKDVLMSQSKLLEALGLKDKAAAARATADSLGDGATKGNLQDADKAQSDDSKALAEALKAPAGKMDDQSKKINTQGLILLASGMTKYTGMHKDIDAFKSGLSGASIMETPKLQTGAYVVTSFPGNLQNLTETMKNAVAFAKTNGIEVPSEATAVI